MAPFNIQRIDFGHLAYQLRKFNVLRYSYHYLKTKMTEMIGTEGSNTKMKITDLPIDCLQEIFDYLDLPNLLNVADSNKRLNIAAYCVFRRKHGKKIVILDNSINYPWNSLCVNDESIFVRDLTVSLRFLRCFRCVILNLRIWFYSNSQNQVNKICFYINEYCAESLIKLNIIGYGKIVFPHLQRPFLNIEIVSFYRCDLGTNVIQFNKWFPKMRHLELFENQTVEKECIEMLFPNLRYLSYYEVTSNNENFVAHFENIIRLNPNLRSLRLHDWSVKLLQNISIYLPQLEELKICCGLIDAAESDYNSDQIHFKSLKKLDIEFYTDISERFLKINFSFDQLEEFHVAGIKFNDLLTFVKKFSTIKKLKLRCFYVNRNLNTENALQVAKALPLLFELHLHLERRLSIDEIIHFVNELKQVKTFYFQLDEQSKCDDLLAILGSEWKVYNDPQKICWKKYIILQRVIK